MISDTQIREHMEVVGSDGDHVGRVDRLLGEEIELAKIDLGSGMKHHLIPRSWVEMADGDKLRLSMTAEVAKTQWRERN